ncbi:1-phosphatidylinositol 4-kinase, partial [Toxoplasma gondii CAST]
MNLEAGERVSNSMSVFPGTLVVNGISQFETSQVCIGALRPHGGVTWCFGFASAYIRCVLVKGGDDLRQELLASQLVRQFKAIFDEARLPLWLRPYE